MNSGTFSRRSFTQRFTSMLSAVGLVSAGLVARSEAKDKTDKGIRKLNNDGTPIVIHNGMIYVAGQGAHDSGPAEQFDIKRHTTIVMDNVKKLVETGGGTVDSILQLTVFLADIKYYDGMNEVFKTYFPNGGPARTTVAVAALPGNSLVEINCSAAVTKK